MTRSHRQGSGPTARRVWDVLPDRENTFIAQALRQETVGGAILLAAALLALVLANSPASNAYESLRQASVGPLTLEHWAADGGLAIFFFLAGLELKRELTIGSLRNPADALVPVTAALCGMLAPAAAYLVVVTVADADSRGWAVPTATDIAFALAVLALVGRSLPGALRAFLLTLAIVDDLGAILIIATVFTEHIQLVPLLGAIVLLVLYALLQRKRVTSIVVYVPLAVACWWLTYQSGVHATIAGVALGLLTRVSQDPGEMRSPAERLDHRLRPLSAGVAVPLFALMSAGVAVHVSSELLGDPVVIGITLALVLGKFVGVLGGAWLAVKLTRASLAEEVGWRDIAGVAALAGIGFTVSLLVADLSFGPAESEHAKAAVLAGSAIAALAASVALFRRNRSFEKT